MCPTKGHKILRKELRQFGVGLGLLLSIAGSVLLWRGRTLGWGLCLLAPLTTLACRYAWPGVMPLFAFWMKGAKAMQRAMTALLLTLIFLAVLTPMALVAKLCRQHFIDRVFRTRRESYWEAPRRDLSSPAAEKQY